MSQLDLLFPVLHKLFDYSVAGYALSALLLPEFSTNYTTLYIHLFPDIYKQQQLISLILDIYRLQQLIHLVLDINKLQLLIRLVPRQFRHQTRALQLDVVWDHTLYLWQRPVGTAKNQHIWCVNRTPIVYRRFKATTVTYTPANMVYVTCITINTHTHTNIVTHTHTHTHTAWTHSGQHIHTHTHTRIYIVTLPPTHDTQTHNTHMKYLLQGILILTHYAYIHTIHLC